MTVWAVSLSTMELSPHSLTHILLISGIRRLVKDGRSEDPRPHSVLYPQREHIWPGLYLFRREPAIAEFDKHFTTNHSSSPHVERCVGSGLQFAFAKPSPWPWLAHPASGRVHATINGLFTLAFTMAPAQKALTSNIQHTR